ncbi:MAG: hypothetical protein RMJ28_04935 [Nitrososphaerota archaeon]|nr:hypothetical protein [Candidatus Calditenuaceae archaeon]MDW8073565.1 hypothetical protein [Nitrososphaerota archaeon]
MVLTAKVFEVREDVSLATIAAKLGEFRERQIVKEEDREIELLTDVREVNAGSKHISGIFSRDKLIRIRQRGKVLPIVKTIEAYIEFRNRGDKILLTVAQEKHFANSVATTLSNALFLNYKSIVEAYIPPENMQQIHESNPEGTKLIWFDQVDIPGVDKLALAGPSLMDTALYQEYLGHGKIWYIVYTTRSGGKIIGLTRNGVVTAFTKMPESEFIDYIVGYVFPLIR